MPQTANTTSTVTHNAACITETDLTPHTEDDSKVNAIRDGKLVEVCWNDLTEDEQRAAYVALFDPCGW